MSNEIQESLGRSYNVPDDIDEEDLMGGKHNGTTCYPYSKEYAHEKFELPSIRSFPNVLSPSLKYKLFSLETLYYYRLCCICCLFLEIYLVVVYVIMQGIGNLCK